MATDTRIYWDLTSFETLDFYQNNFGLPRSESASLNNDGDTGIYWDLRSFETLDFIEPSKIRKCFLE